MPDFTYVVFKKGLLKDYAFVYFKRESRAKEYINQNGKRYYYKSIPHSLDD